MNAAVQQQHVTRVAPGLDVCKARPAIAHVQAQRTGAGVNVMSIPRNSPCGDLRLRSHVVAWLLLSKISQRTLDSVKSEPVEPRVIGPASR